MAGATRPFPASNGQRVLKLETACVARLTESSASPCEIDFTTVVELLRSFGRSLIIQADNNDARHLGLPSYTLGLDPVRADTGTSITDRLKQAQRRARVSRNREASVAMSAM